MATVKHINIHNSNYNSAVEYLTYEHNELTKKPIRDASGRMIERDNYLIDGINCSPDTYGRECAAVNRIYGKNTGFNEVKAHHYIVSFDPDDKTENGLTMEHAHELGMKLAEDCFPGHQVIVCTHPDGHNGIGNIHCHIVLNSVRKDDIEEQRFTERSSDLIAGNKHHCSEGFMTFFKQEVMDTCNRENLYQIDLLSPAKVKITEREYWAQRRGQAALDKKNAELIQQGIKPSETRFETEKGFLRSAITTVMMDSHSLEEFQKKLLAQYGIEVHESRGRFSYLSPDRNKPITGRKLGTDFEKGFIEIYVRQSAGKTLISPKMDINERINIVKDLDQESKTRYKVLDNLKGKSATQIFMEENGLSGLDDLRKLKQSVNDDLYLKQKTVKDIDAQINRLQKQKRVTAQYFSTRRIYQQYLKSKNKQKFREEHDSDLRIYEAARKTLNEEFGGQDLMQIKDIDQELTRLKTEIKPKLVEDLSFVRKQAYKINIHEENFTRMHSDELSKTDKKELS